MIHWVFGGRRGHSVREDDLGPQLDLGFAFTGPLEIAVVPETKRTSSAPAGSSVQGAPLGSAAIEKGCPPGQHAEAAPAAPRPAPGAVCFAAAPKAAAKRAPRAAAKTAPKAEPGQGRGRGKGRGRGRAAAAAAAPAGAPAPAAADGVSPAAEAEPPAPAEPSAKKRRISIPPGVKVGCGKCKHDEVGSTTCRPKAGLVESDKKGVWILKPAV